MDGQTSSLLRLGRRAPEQVLIDSAAVNAHCYASSGRGTQSGDRSLARRPHHQDARADNRVYRPIAFNADGRPDCRLIVGELSLKKMQKTSTLLGDNGYSNAIRRQSKPEGQDPTSHRKPIDDGRIASRLSFIETATVSSACWVASRTSLRTATCHDRNASNFFAAVCLPQPSAIGYESRPYCLRLTGMRFRCSPDSQSFD